MASLVKKGDIFGLIWTDSKRTPVQVRESLKTENKKRAKEKKKQLEWGYHNKDNPHFPEDQKHDPWKKKWYETTDESENIDLPELIEDFISYKSTIKGQKGWSEKVAQRETYVLRKFGRIVGDQPLSQLTNKNLQRFYYRDGVTSDHTRQGDHISVNTFLNWCIEKGHLQEKPDFKPSKPQTKIPKFIYPEELATVIHWQMQYVKDARAVKNFAEEYSSCWSVLAWMILAGTGMRPIELCKLKVNHIHKHYAIIGEDFTVKVRSERQLPLLYESYQATQLLTEQKFRSLENNMRRSNYLLGRDPDYAADKLNRYFVNAWNTCYPEKKRTLYNLKDMFAVRFLSDDSIPSPSGMKLNELREILGHSSLETTQKYLKAVPFGTNIQGTIWDFPGVS